MDTIYKWINDNNLWYVTGLYRTRREFSAEIWTNLYHIKRMGTIGWWGKGKTPEEALQMAYEKAVVGLPNIPKTEEEFIKRIYYPGR